MELLEAMKERHSVRAFDERSIDPSAKEELLSLMKQCNQEGHLHIQLVQDEPKAFDSFMAHYGKFSGVRNYMALVGKKGPDLEECCGYYGEKLVLKAQQLGLNTCWVAMSYRKIPGAFQLGLGEKAVAVIALGYGKTQGTAHRSKTVEQVVKASHPMPEWFVKGVESALLAPSAVNQQKFTFALNQNRVLAKAGLAFYSKVDLGIVKYHFELGAGTENFQWEKS